MGLDEEQADRDEPEQGQELRAAEEVARHRPGFTPRQWSSASAATTAAASIPWLSGAERLGTMYDSPAQRARHCAVREHHEANAIQPTANPTQSPKAARA